ncbi:MAG: dihydroorotate dehydrogenase electron transfer subunit [Gracilibacteraceae bacterium]|jgi:dihydroorotate dehydrogenase electron transfer subunit|nr:dihydroorotate dehydrogenase electron transfer subunit [Gracilibacteraceae bacterium]
MLSQEKILINRPMGPAHNSQGLFKLVLHGRVAEEAQPGQFVTVRTSPSSDPLLRRPLSIAGIDKKAGEITLYYRVKGQGTTLLARQPEGTYLSVLGPLGQGFSLPAPSPDPASRTANPAELILAAGGIGIFALYSLLEYLLKNHLTDRIPVTVLWGGLDKAFLDCATTDLLFQLPKNNVVLCTMDGSYGYEGLVTEPLEQLLSAGRKGRETMVAACGPNVMLQAVTELCQRFYVSSEVCMEEYMACGLGACRGCVCRLKDETGGVKHGRVCLEGPVFTGEEVVWHDRI